nr:carboxypeptidase regulatory-like domain-containing protein [Bacteroidota bacterium]
AYGENSFNINYWWLDNINVFEAVWVNVSGIVTELDGGAPVADAVITIMDTEYEITTLADGTYSIDIYAGTYDLGCTKAGYNPQEQLGVVIDADYVWDVQLTAPTFTVDPLLFDEELEVGWVELRDIFLTNDGNGPVDWTANIQFPVDNHMAIEISEVTSTKDAETHGEKVKPNLEFTDALFDLQFAYDVETTSGLVSHAGAETDGNFFYTAIWNSANINKFALDGTFIETFTIAGVTGLRDLAFDGTYFYGAAAGTNFWEMDFTNKTLVSTITAPAAVRACAYDNNADGFWGNNWAADMLLFDRSGTQLNSIAGVPSMYGCAYDKLTAGGPSLWFFAGTSTGGGCWVEQWDIATAAATGLLHSVSGDLGADRIAGGLFLAEDIVLGTYTLCGCAQGTPNTLFGYELGSTSTPWISIDMTSGTIPGVVKGTETVVMTLNAADGVLGQTYIADIVFSSSPDVGTQTVHVEMYITGDLGTLAGTVTDPITRAPVAGVTITADELRGFSTVTGEDGTYTMDILIGDYWVTAEKEGYVTQTTPEPVTIVLDGLTVQDFLLEFSPPELLSAEADYFGVNLTWAGNPLFIPIDRSNYNLTQYNTASVPQKEEPTGVYTNPGGIRQGGDLIADATPIAAIPFYEVGTTDGYNNDYDEACPYTGSTAPDVVYSYTPVDNMIVSITLCESGYDTKLYIYENEYTPGLPYACNDDYVDCPDWQSQLDALFMGGGNTYFIVIDGYGTDFGEYTIDMWGEPYVPCAICPPNGIPEPELCGEALNDGCNMEAGTETWTPIACGDIYCGTAWADGGSRDTDWYEIVTDGTKKLTWTAMADFPVLIFIIDGNAGCDGLEILNSATADACVPVSIDAIVPAGTYWFWIGASVFEGSPCGTTNGYVADLACEDAFLMSFNVNRDGQQIAEVYGETFYDDGVNQGDMPCYTVSQNLLPGLTTDNSNEMCAFVPYMPAIAVDPLSLSESLPVGGTSQQILSVLNTDMGDLEFTVEILGGGKDNVAVNNFPQSNPEFTENDENAVGSHAILEPTDDDVLTFEFAYPNDPAYPGQAGVETDGTYLYTTDWQTADAGTFYAYDASGGAFVGVITVPGLTAVGGGLRDMAYDGTYFYGGYATTTCYEFTLDGGSLTGTLISQWIAPTACRAIAYNEDNDTFIANNWSSDPTEFDRAGATVSSFVLSGVFSSYYGFAYDNLTAGGPFLWGFAQTGGPAAATFVQMTFPAGAETGYFYDVIADVGGTSSAGGMCFYPDMIRGGHMIIGNVQNWAIAGYSLFGGNVVLADDFEAYTAGEQLMEQAVAMGI